MGLSIYVTFAQMFAVAIGVEVGSNTKNVAAKRKTLKKRLVFHLLLFHTSSHHFICKRKGTLCVNPLSKGKRRL